MAEGTSDPFSPEFTGRDQANAKMALAMGKQNLKVLQHAQKELAKLSNIKASGKTSLMISGDIVKLEKQLHKVTGAAQKTAVALDKAFKAENSTQIQRQTRALQRHENTIHSLNEEISETSTRATFLGKVQGTFKDKWFRFASGATAAALALKTFKNSSDIAQFAIGDLIASGKSIPDATSGIVKDLFGKEIGAALTAGVTKGASYLKVLHEIGFAAIRTGRTIEEMTAAARDVQFRLHPKSMKDLVKYTEQASMLARFLKIDMSEAVDFMVERQRRFGDSMEHSTKTMSFMVKIVNEANDAFGTGTIEVDEFSNMIMDASRGATSYAQNLRVLSKVLRNHIVDVQLQGGSYREAMDSAKALKGLIQDAPTWVQFKAGKTLLDQIMGMDKSDIENFLGDLEGGAKKTAVATVMDIQRLRSTGAYTEAGASQALQVAMGQTFEGMKATLEQFQSATSIKALQRMMEADDSQLLVVRNTWKMLEKLRGGSLREFMTAKRTDPLEAFGGRGRKGTGAMGDTPLALTGDDKNRIAAIEQAHTALIDKLGKKMAGLQLTDVSNQISRLENMLNNPLVSGSGAVLAGIAATPWGAAALGGAAGLAGAGAGGLVTALGTMSGHLLKLIGPIAVIAAGITGGYFAGEGLNKWGLARGERKEAMVKERVDALTGKSALSFRPLSERNEELRADTSSVWDKVKGDINRWWTDFSHIQFGTSRGTGYDKRPTIPPTRRGTEDKPPPGSTGVPRKQSVGGSSVLRSDGSLEIREVYVIPKFTTRVAESNAHNQMKTR